MERLLQWLVETQNTLENFFNRTRIAGSYPASCDPSRDYKHVPELLKAYDLGWLLQYFRKYWKVRVNLESSY
jgi:hypothetical protein